MVSGRRPRPITCVDLMALRGYRFKSVREAAAFFGFDEHAVYVSAETGRAVKWRYVFKWPLDFSARLVRDDNGKPIL